MFTLSISFLIFAASSFTLISTLIEKTALSLIGADLCATATFSPNALLDEIPMQEFLENQMAEEGQPVWDYAFFSVKTDFYMVNGGSPVVMDNSRYSSVPVQIYGLPVNYLNVTDVDFYVPTDIQGGLVHNMTSNGKIDAVGLLFSDEDTKPYPTTDLNCPTCGENIDYYNISVSPLPFYYWFPNTVKMILPSGARHALNAKAGDIIRVTNDNSGNT